mgnify:CR=1 FL=1
MEEVEVFGHTDIFVSDINVKIVLRPAVQSHFHDCEFIMDVAQYEYPLRAP